MLKKRILNIAPFFRDWVNDKAQSLEPPRVVIGRDYDRAENFTIFFNPETTKTRNKGDTSLSNFDGNVTIYYTLPDMCECCDCWITELENLYMCNKVFCSPCGTKYYIEKLVTTEATILNNDNVIAISFGINLRIAELKEEKCY